MIDRYLIRYFMAVIDRGSFSAAAQHCGVSQPTLSAGIAKLEKLLRAPVFLRNSRRVELTLAGARFAPHARRIESEFAEAIRSVQEPTGIRLIRLGVASTLPASWLEAAIRAMRQNGVGEQIELVEGRMRDLEPKLQRGRLDALLGPLADMRDSTPILSEGYAMALPSSHALAGRARIAAEELAGEPMIVRRQCEALSEISRFFTARGVRPLIAARTSNDDRAVAYVRAGLGITVLPQCFAQEGITMVPLNGFSLERTVGLRDETDSRGRVANSGALSAFTDAIRAAAISN